MEDYVRGLGRFRGIRPSVRQRSSWAGRPWTVQVRPAGSYGFRNPRIPFLISSSSDVNGWLNGMATPSQTDAPDASKLPQDDIVGVTVILLTCLYQDKVRACIYHISRPA